MIAKPERKMPIVSIQTSGSSLPRLAISDGTVEGLKWLALLSMTVDHVNKYVLHDSIQACFAFGRLALPLFGFVLAYNLARHDVLWAGAYRRVIVRLFVFAVIASVPVIAMGKLSWGWWPLNILFTLLLSTIVIYLVDWGNRRQIVIAVLAFLLIGSIVEFWWPAVALCVCSWAYCRKPNWVWLALWIASVASLYIVNRNMWALVALPIIFLAPAIHLPIPRAKWLFYAYYPLHLLVIWGIVAWN